jgi:signal transduction histidine kinase
VDAAEVVKDRREQITERWRVEVAKLPELAALPPSALVDHLPEFLFELATWAGGDDSAATRAYVHMIEGHALTRLGHGVDLETLLSEYQLLRQVMLSEILAHVRDDPDGIVAVNRALDLAISESVRAYTRRRDEVRERFVGILSHDLRNPLMALSLAAESILETPCSQAAHARLANAIGRGGDRMSRMIADLGDFALGQLGGGIPAVPQTCDMGEICREAVSELRAAHAGRQIDLETRGDLAGSWDRDRCLQVMSNLVANAIVHGEDPIRVLAYETEDHEHVITEVHNSGRPIPPDAIGHVFDPFKRGARAKRGGLGLGLYIVRQIALSHGGDCTVESTPEAGTTFRIKWPRTPLSVMRRPYQDDVR